MHRRRSRAAGWRTVVTTIRGEFDCVRFVRPIRCRRADVVVFCAGTGSSDRRIPGDRFLSRDVTGFPGASDLAGVCLPFRVVSAVLNPFCLVSVHALLLRRLLAVFFGFVVLPLSVGLSFSLFGSSFPFLSCRRGYVPESCIRRVSRFACAGEGLVNDCETGLKMGAGRQYFRWR